MNVTERSCPRCGHPGVLNENTGRRMCGNPECPNIEDLSPEVEMVTIPAATYRGAVEQVERVVELAERYGEAIAAISAALPNENRVRAIIAGLDPSRGQ